METRPRFGLTARIVTLSIVFLLLGEVLIFVPSLAAFRYNYLEDQLMAAKLATLVPEQVGAGQVTEELEEAMLAHTRMEAIQVVRGKPVLMLGSMVEPDVYIDLDRENMLSNIFESFITLFHQGERTISVSGTTKTDENLRIEVIFSEKPLYRKMVDYGWRIGVLSLILSALLAVLLVFSLRLIIILPLKRLALDLTNFRQNPEKETGETSPSKRQDEIGIVERAMYKMRSEVRENLHQKRRLAGLGQALASINHDLRNTVSTGILISDRLEASSDPMVRKAATRLTKSLDRAIRLCEVTMNYASHKPYKIQLKQLSLAHLIDMVLTDLSDIDRDLDIHVNISPPDLAIISDSDLLYRAIFNIANNAVQATRLSLIQSADRQPMVGIEAVYMRDDNKIEIDIWDSGPGIPKAVQDKLFQPFSPSQKADGHGLGIAISHEIIKRLDGSLFLKKTGASGTVFTFALYNPTIIPAKKLPQPLIQS